jgi:hypothetical protein
VLVLTQEEMEGDLAGFIGKAVAFSGAVPRIALPGYAGREAVSYPEFASPVLRRINHFRADSPSAEPVFDLGPVAKLVYRGAGKLARLDPVRRQLGHYRPVTVLIRDRFGARFAESNRALKDSARTLISTATRCPRRQRTCFARASIGTATRSPPPRWTGRDRFNTVDISRRIPVSVFRVAIVE